MKYDTKAAMKANRVVTTPADLLFSADLSIFFVSPFFTHQISKPVKKPIMINIKMTDPREGIPPSPQKKPVT
jgi:hypothetical protein